MELKTYLIGSIVEYNFNGLRDIGIVKFTCKENNENIIVIRHYDGSLLYVPESFCKLLFFQDAELIYNAYGENIA